MLIITNSCPYIQIYGKISLVYYRAREAAKKSNQNNWITGTSPLQAKTTANGAFQSGMRKGKGDMIEGYKSMAWITWKEKGQWRTSVRDLDHNAYLKG